MQLCFGLRTIERRVYIFLAQACRKPSTPTFREEYHSWCSYCVGGLAIVALFELWPLVGVLTSR